VTPRRAQQDGQASVEFVSLLPYLVLIAMLVVQMQLFVSTATAVENAARNAARVASDGGDAFATARTSLAGANRSALRPSDVRVRGEEVEVELRVPLVLPVFRTSAWTVTRSATFARQEALAWG
jgi:hypothetical protein